MIIASIKIFVPTLFTSKAFFLFLFTSFIGKSNKSIIWPLNRFDGNNCVIKIKTTLTAFDLLEFAKNIEKQLGRNISDQRYSPRLIDIDILSYGQHIIDSKKLKVPHPSIGERKFVLKPWADLDSNYILANNRKKIFDLLNELSDNTKLTFIE